MALPDWTIVGFTGHRKLDRPGAADAGIRRALDRLAATHPYLAAVTSAASGADTLFLEAIHERGIPSSLLLPFSLDRFREDFAEADWRRVEPLLDRALEREVITSADSPQQAYLEAGTLTVDRADVLVAVWDGQPANGMGGTGDVVAYARSLEKPLVIVDPETGALAEERMDALRSSPAEADTPPLAADRDLREQVEGHYTALDQQASRHAPRARLLLLRIILLHLAATAIAVVSVTMHLTGWMGYAATALKLAALLWALVLVAWHHHAHHEWVHARVAAELCRSYLAMWTLRRSRAAEPRNRIEGYDRLHGALRMMWRLDREAAADFDTARRQYLAGRVEHQLAYYRQGHRQAGWRYHALRTAATTATILAILAAAAALVLALLHREDWLYDVIKTLSILLPLVNAAMLSLVVAQDYGRRVTRYHDMIAHLERLAKRIQAAPNWTGLWRSVSETETVLLQEVIEWHTLAKVTSESH